MTGHGELDVDFRGKGHIHKVNSSVELVVRLGHVECVRIAGGQIVITRASQVLWIAHIVVLLITFVTMVTSDALGGATTFARFAMTKVTVSVTGTRSAGASIDWIAIEAFDALVAIGSFGKILTRCTAHSGRCLQAIAVAIALTSGTRGKEPVGGRTALRFQYSVGGIDCVGSPRRALKTNSNSSAGPIVAPSTLGILQAFVTRLNVGAGHHRALVWVSGPFHTLPDWVDGRVSVRLDALLLGAAPHARALGAILTSGSTVAWRLTAGPLVFLRQFL